METIQKSAFARAGLLGNPSDGYGGKTISFAIEQLSAIVTIKPDDQLNLVPSDDDQNRYSSIDDLANTVRRCGYYGGIRLVKASIKRFHDYCVGRHDLHTGNFRISYQTNIPRNVGLAGSSAIITAALRALSAFYGYEIKPEIMASLAWSVEVNELGIPAGMQDRVIQSLQGLVYMDFAQQQMQTVDSLEIGHYERLPTDGLANFYIAYGADKGEPTEVVHQNLRQRFDEGDPEVNSAMQQFASFAEAGKAALLTHDNARLDELIDQNFDLRAKICRLRSSHMQMVQTARQSGASAKFCGSGGAIVGTVQDDAMFADLQQRLNHISCHVFQPVIAGSR